MLKIKNLYTSVQWIEMASEGQEYSADGLPKSIASFSINTTTEECRQAYAAWSKTYEKVLFMAHE